SQRGDEEEEGQERDDRDERADREAAGAGGSRGPGAPVKTDRPSGGGGFFTIYKSGQGYWTRLGTALGAALILAFTAYFVWEQLSVWQVGYVNGRPRPAIMW